MTLATFALLAGCSQKTQVATQAPIESVKNVDPVPSLACPAVAACPPAPKPKPAPVVTCPPPGETAEAKPEEKPRNNPPPEGSALENVRAIGPGEALPLLGKKVWGADGEDLGRVIDVLIDPAGRIRSAVIDFGGFLGVGNRKIAVEWSLLKFKPDGKEKQIVLALDREKVLAAPEYKSAEPSAEVIAPSATAKHGS